MRPESGSTQTSPHTPEVVEVHEHRVWCDGGGGALGHPRVYMEMGAAGVVDCGYCDRRFVMAGHGHVEDEHTAPAAWQGANGER